MDADPKPIRIEQMFASPLFGYHHDDGGALNRQLLAEAHQIRSASSGVKRSNQRGWHSDADFFRRTEPGCQTLQRFIVRCLSDAITRVTEQRPRQMILEGWININPTGGYNVPHDHAGYIWSGTYYVNVPPSPGDGTASRGGHIEFLDPRTAVDPNVFKTKFRVAPHAGLLLIFPSYLLHWVYPNEHDDERVTIAFNCRPIAAAEGAAAAPPGTPTRVST